MHLHLDRDTPTARCGVLSSDWAGLRIARLTGKRGIRAVISSSVPCTHGVRRAGNACLRWRIRRAGAACASLAAHRAARRAAHSGTRPSCRAAACASPTAALGKGRRPQGQKQSCCVGEKFLHDCSSFGTTNHVCFGLFQIYIEKQYLKLQVTYYASVPDTNWNVPLLALRCLI